MRVQSYVGGLSKGESILVAMKRAPKMEMAIID
jgi:hypothetical protein